MKRVAVLGSTGSIGVSCLDVLAAHSDKLALAAVSAHRKWEALVEQVRQFSPRWAVLSDPDGRSHVEQAPATGRTEWRFGAEALVEIASHPDVDVVVSGIVGAAGLHSTWAAVECGKQVALANKETLVVAGPLIMNLARNSGAVILPVDSEHNAIFQCLRSGSPKEVRRVILTASGGPFRGWSREQFEDITPERALAHPTWDMGPKITIDSATMMNKALEIIEAKWLFDLAPEQIEVVVHPQSIVHSMVEFVDGSVVAQLSPPDMRLPIQYALTYPERWEGVSPRLSWSESWRLDFQPPDRELFPALDLGYEVARRGGTCGAVLNAANEVAVERFLRRELKFTDIPRACRAVLDAHEFDPSPTLDRLCRLDEWARKEMMQWN
ncbi:MAG: 1-deoxy-D-xylulose-5-phosphate reductoisomerase [Planctomycetaceae bacterium]